jgi:hypothetical protein
MARHHYLWLDDEARMSGETFPSQTNRAIPDTLKTRTGDLPGALVAGCVDPNILRNEAATASTLKETLNSPYNLVFHRADCGPNSELLRLVEMN